MALLKTSRMVNTKKNISPTLFLTTGWPYCTLILIIWLDNIPSELLNWFCKWIVFKAKNILSKCSYSCFIVQYFQHLLNTAVHVYPFHVLLSLFKIKISIFHIFLMYKSYYGISKSTTKSGKNLFNIMYW